MEATGGVQGSTFHHPWHEQPEELVAMTEAPYYSTNPNPYPNPNPNPSRRSWWP